MKKNLIVEYQAIGLVQITSPIIETTLDMRNLTLSEQGNNIKDGHVS